MTAYCYLYCTLMYILVVYAVLKSKHCLKKIKRQSKVIKNNQVEKIKRYIIYLNNKLCYISKYTFIRSISII